MQLRVPLVSVGLLWTLGLVCALVTPGCVSFESFVSETGQLEAPCFNGIQDGDELGVDCGGADCDECAPSGPTSPTGPGPSGPTGPCVPETDAELCGARACGSLTATDRCGAARSVTSCGGCPTIAPHTCDDGVCTCTLTPESDAELCAAAERSCGALSVSDRCGVSRTAQCGSCYGGRACLPSGDCEPVCPALPVVDDPLKGDRILIDDGAKVFRLDRQRTVLVGANADLSTLVLWYNGTLDLGPSVCNGTNPTYYFADRDPVSGHYRLAAMGTQTQLQGHGLTVALEDSFAVSRDGLSLIAPNTARTALVRVRRSSARGVTPVVWQLDGANVALETVSAFATANAQTPALSPDESLLFYSESTPFKAFMATRASDGSYAAPRDITAELNTGSGGDVFHFVQSVSGDNLTLSAYSHSNPFKTRFFRRPNRFSPWASLNTAADESNATRVRLHEDCRSAAGMCEGGCANERTCLREVSACVPETDMAFCARLGASCSVTELDTCGRVRTVACGASGGACANGSACSAAGRCDLLECPGSDTAFVDVDEDPTNHPAFVEEDGSTPVAADTRMYLNAVSSDGETMLVTRGGCSGGATVYFADRLPAQATVYRLVYIGTEAELAARGLDTGNALGLTRDGLALLSSFSATNDTVNDTLVSVRRGSKQQSFSLAASPITNFATIISASAAGRRISSPVLSNDGQLLTYVEEDAVGTVLAVPQMARYADGFFRPPGTPHDLAAQLTLDPDGPGPAPTQIMRPMAIGSGGLLLLTGFDRALLPFGRSSLSAPFSEATQTGGTPSMVSIGLTASCSGDVLFYTSDEGGCTTQRIRRARLLREEL